MKDALIAAMGQDYDLLVLDRMVPGLDGLSVLKSLRASKNSTPALFLTALGEIDSRVEGFEAGGDDYLTKPFELEVLSDLVVKALTLKLGIQKERLNQAKLSQKEDELKKKIENELRVQYKQK